MTEHLGPLVRHTGITGRRGHTAQKCSDVFVQCYKVVSEVSGIGLLNCMVGKERFKRRRLMQYGGRKRRGGA